MIANVAGTGFTFVKEKYPYLNNIDIKWSYDPFKKSYFKSIMWNKNKSFMDDYERHNYWISFNVAGITNNKIKYVPDWLNIGVGFSAQHLTGIDHGKSGKLEIFLGFDINPKKLFDKFEMKNKISKKTIDYLNCYHLPAPACRLTPEYNYYIMKF